MRQGGLPDWEVGVALKACSMCPMSCPLLKHWEIELKSISNIKNRNHTKYALLPQSSPVPTTKCSLFHNEDCIERRFCKTDEISILLQWWGEYQCSMILLMISGQSTYNITRKQPILENRTIICIVQNTMFQCKMYLNTLKVSPISTKQMARTIGLLESYPLQFLKYLDIFWQIRNLSYYS